MMYTAILLCPAGGVVRDEETQQVANVEVGDFESMNEAIDHACYQLECAHIHNGVITKGYGKGGYMLVTTQELEEV